MYGVTVMLYDDMMGSDKDKDSLKSQDEVISLFSLFNTLKILLLTILNTSYFCKSTCTLRFFLFVMILVYDEC